MKKTYRVLALFFALLMVAACFVGCKDDKKKDDAVATTTVSSGDGDATEGYVSKLPSMDWQEAIFMILGNESTSFEIAREELPEDVVGKAVYERNDALRTKYNFMVQETLVADTYAEMAIRYGAGEDLYDAVIYTPTNAAKHAQERYFLDLRKLPHIDLQHPSWNQYANEQLTIMGTTYFTISDFLLSDKNRYFIMHYNRDMAREAGKGYLEDMVENNTWTFDNFNALVQEFSEDGNGDGKKGSPLDYYGVACESIGTYSLFLYGGGFRLSNTVDGVITMAGSGDNIIKILKESAPFALNYDVVYYPDKHHKDPMFGGNAYGSETDMFTGERALFLSAFLQSLDKLQENATFERAYMPYPKYDDKQENYYTIINDLGAAVITVPYTVADTEKSGYMLEAITEASTDTTFNAYFEERCKLQGSVDQRAADMLDLIFENVVFDAAYIYNLGTLRDYLVLELPLNGAYQRYNKIYDARARNATTQIEAISAAYAEAAAE